MADVFLFPPLDYDHISHAVFLTDQNKVALAHGAPKWFKAAILHDNFPYPKAHVLLLSCHSSLQDEEDYLGCACLHLYHDEILN